MSNKTIRFNKDVIEVLLILTSENMVSLTTIIDLLDTIRKDILINETTLCESNLLLLSVVTFLQNIAEATRKREERIAGQLDYE